MNVKIEVTVYRDQDICCQIEDLIAQLKLGGRFLPHFSAGLGPFYPSALKGLKP